MDGGFFKIFLIPLLIVGAWLLLLPDPTSQPITVSLQGESVWEKAGSAASQLAGQVYDSAARRVEENRQRDCAKGGYRPFLGCSEGCSPCAPNCVCFNAQGKIYWANGEYK